MTKYIAKLDGKIVGTRTTASRTYTHALIVQDVEEVARNAAYNYTSTKTDSSNFEYSSFIAKQQPGVLCRPRGWSTETKFKAAEIVAAHELVEGSFDAYVRRLRERHIAGFEARKTKGGFEPFVATWCGRLDLAQKAVTAHTSAARQFIAIVPAEEVVKAKA